MGVSILNSTDSTIKILVHNSVLELKPLRKESIIMPTDSFFTVERKEGIIILSVKNNEKGSDFYNKLEETFELIYPFGGVSSQSTLNIEETLTIQLEAKNVTLKVQKIENKILITAREDRETQQTIKEVASEEINSLKDSIAKASLLLSELDLKTINRADRKLINDTLDEFIEKMKEYE